MKVKLLLLTLISLLFALGMVGCKDQPHGITQEDFEAAVTATTQAEAEALLGPGGEVRDYYTDSVVEAHRLPASARFLRWTNRELEGVFHHVVIVEGEIVERTTWDTRTKGRGPR